MYVRISILLIFFIQCTVSKKIDTTATEVIPREYLIQEDNLSQLKVNASNQLFAIKGNNQLMKYDSTGRVLARYDAQQYGKIHTYTIDKGLRHLLYYRNFEEIKILDPFFAEIQSIQLKDWNLYDIVALNQSNDNALWIYDQNLRKLRKFNLRGQELFSSVDLYTVTDASLQIVKLWEYAKKVYLLNDLGDLIILDNLGNYLGVRKWNVNSTLVFRDQALYFKKDSEIHKIDFTDMLQETQKVITKIQDAESFDVLGTQVFLVNPKGIFVKKARNLD